jgi:DNA polymerase-3 subunit epsilon
VGKCRGACIGEETPESHNVRLATALAPHRLLDWPFEGRIIVREANPESGIEEGHVFERWSHLGTARSEEDLAELADARVEIDFDPDVYRILATPLRPVRRPRREMFEPGAYEQALLRRPREGSGASGHSGAW